MNCSVVYKDELVSYNPITGEVEFVKDFSKCTQRAEGKSENIAGYYACFKLLTGFRKELFMTTAEVDNHARKYSTAYRYDLENNKKGSKWTTDFEAMALKTVIKMLLASGVCCQWICREQSRTIRKFTARMAMEVTVTTSRTS